MQKRALRSFYPRKINWGPSPNLGKTLETPFSPLSFGKFHEIRSAIPENGCLIFCGRWKKTEKKTKKHL